MIIASLLLIYFAIVLNWPHYLLQNLPIQIYITVAKWCALMTHSFKSMYSVCFQKHFSSWTRLISFLNACPSCSPSTFTERHITTPRPVSRFANDGHRKRVSQLLVFLWQHSWRSNATPPVSIVATTLHEQRYDAQMHDLLKDNASRVEMSWPLTRVSPMRLRPCAPALVEAMSSFPLASVGSTQDYDSTMTNRQASGRHRMLTQARFSKIRTRLRVLVLLSCPLRYA